MIRSVQRVHQVLRLTDDIINNQTIPVTCANEVLSIPYRVDQTYGHSPGGEEMLTFSDTEQIIAFCWFSRHPDGHVRERFLRLFIDFDTPLIISYVMPLCGEYVIEILDYVWERRCTFDPDFLGIWLRENRPYYVRIRRRIVSYWNCYYRAKFPQFDEYVGGRLLTFFDGLAIKP